MNIDPVRLRVEFLGILDDSARRAFIDEALSALRKQLERVRAHVDQQRASGDRFSFFAARGAELTIGAQIGWLNELRAAV